MEDLAADHNVWPILVDILLILGLSGLIIPALQRIRVSPVIGYLFCGLLIGPYGIATFAPDIPVLDHFAITDNKLIPVLAELGVVFLLFMIGLELTWSRLWELRKYVLGVGTGQILVTATIIFLIAQYFGNSLPASILIGAAFALSSTAVVMQLMTEWHLISKPVGRVCFSVLLMQDLAVVPILVMVGAFSDGAASGGGGVLYLLIKALITAIVVVGGIFISGKLLFRPTLRLLSPSKNVEWLLAIILFLVIGSAMLTYYFGLSAALGAFLAGLLLAETEYRHEVEVIIEPLKGMLMGVFFLSVGMATNVAEIISHPVWILSSVIGIFLLKAAIFYPVARLFKVAPRKAMQSALLLAQAGEFAFIVIGLALMGGIFSYEDAQFFLLIATASLLLSPFTMRTAFLIDKFGRARRHDDDLPDDRTKANHIVIAGFGRVGLTLANILEDQKMSYIAIDKDGLNVGKRKKEGYPVVRGDARNIQLWSKLNIADAKAAVITIDDFASSRNILNDLRKKHPLLPIIIRSRDTHNIECYYEEGASAVVPETLESSLQLVRTLLEQTGVEEDAAKNIVDKHRIEALSGVKPCYVEVTKS
jgi:CPA2 family monovalent cation:H+ antiporter-2